MKMCHSEIIKRIKELEDKKSALLSRETSRKSITYTDASQKVTPKYSYCKTREDVDKIDEEIRKLKCALAKANCTVIVENFNVTIGEALILLGQLQQKCSLLKSMSEMEQISQTVNYAGKTQFEECTFDVEKATEDYENTLATISKLQVAIDRANLVNLIEL